MSQLKSLMYIEFHKNVSLKDLSQALKMAQPNATNLVEFLVKEGLVSRRENPGDRRMLILKTTAKAKKLIGNLRDSMSTEMSYLRQLNLQQLRTLNDGLQPVLKLIQKEKNGP